MNNRLDRKIRDSAPTRFPNAPPRVAALPTDHRGYPVPHFTPVFNGIPDFVAADPRKITKCHRQRRCWICGQRMGRMNAFVIGPMCSVNRISIEPPSHPECADFATIACPFMSRPLAKRAHSENASEPPPGIMLTHNPGASLIWWTLRYKAFPLDGGMAFEIGAPERCIWRREGREASRKEILEAFDIGLPKLRHVAELEGPEAVADMELRLKEALDLLPAY